MPFEHTITRLVARKVRGTFWTLGAVLALGSLAHAETIEFRHEGGAGLSELPGPHAITKIFKNGNTTPSSTLAYDANGLLTDVTGDMPLCHEFNVLGKLKRASSEARKSDGCSGATSISYLYTATGEKLAVIEPNKTNVFMGEVRFTNNVPRLSYGGDVETSEDGSSLNYYVRDHLGSVVATASPTQILEKRDHLPYGETWYHTQAGNEYSDRDFNGHYKQGSLLDYNARHYHPTLGKFIQPDSIVPKTDTVGFNRYAYVSNNPVNRIDPSGHFEVPFDGSATSIRPTRDFVLELTERYRSEIFFQRVPGESVYEYLRGGQTTVSGAAWTGMPSGHTHPWGSLVDTGSPTNLAPSPSDFETLSIKYLADSDRRALPTFADYIHTRGPNGEPMTFAFRVTELEGTRPVRGEVFYKYPNGERLVVKMNISSQGTRSIHRMVQGHLTGSTNLQEVARVFPRSVNFIRRIPGVAVVVGAAFGTAENAIAGDGLMDGAGRGALEGLVGSIPWVGDHLVPSTLGRSENAIDWNNPPAPYNFSNVRHGFDAVNALYD